MFSFTESGGSVLMMSSGTLNTGNLVSVSADGWGLAGIETNSPPESDIMGDTISGPVDTAFAFHAGTDLTPWIGDMFVSDNFGWSTSGTTQFTTYYVDAFQRTPGIGIAAEDLVGNFWTPNISWTQPGTFASLGLTEGNYTITDAVTAESISIQIGGQLTVPEPTSFVLYGFGLCVAGFGSSRRRRHEKS
tara:strand:- start:17670 stop:18239 length:570 start_codon:yes stop_codon:yes gene_type:complete